MTPSAARPRTIPREQDYELLVDGVWRRTAEAIDVVNPFGGERVARIASATSADALSAVDAAHRALATPLPAHVRHDVLMRAADRVEARQDEYAWAIASEGSKTIREARREPPRAATILRLCAAEARQISGRTLPFDIRPGSENRVGYYTKVPVGVIVAITPFNDPLAVAAHKVGPALAAGNAVVVKPASATPQSALWLGADLMEAGLPAGRINVVTGHGSTLGPALVGDSRVRMISFTGGVETGEEIARRAGIKKLSMELGSNSPVIVQPDADLPAAAAAVTSGAFAQAGQNCLGVQRVFAHDAIYETFRGLLLDRVARLKPGSSLDESVDVCAMINERQACRLEAWIRQAEETGARVLTGGRREGALLWPTVLEAVAATALLDREEAYGPVVSLYRTGSLDEAIARANNVPYGLHAAIFTESLREALQAAQRLSAGAVIVNDSTDYRLDVMPFGGTRLSGIGREGVPFAVEEMTETRVVCFNG